jgi:hypothetical protein
MRGIVQLSMKNILTSKLALSVLCFFCVNLAHATPPPDETNSDFLEARQALNEINAGVTPLSELNTNVALGHKLMLYYFAQNEQISTKSKLPISLCFALAGKFSEAAKLSTEYVNIYSNDWQGWSVLGGSEFAMGSNEEAVEALLQAVKLGDKKNYRSLGAAALSANRVDVLRDWVVPKLLIENLTSSSSEENRLQNLLILTVYSINTTNETVFTKAVQSVDPELIVSQTVEKNLKTIVLRGCDIFESEEATKICERIKKAAEDTDATSH